MMLVEKISIAKPYIGKPEKDILCDVIDSGWISTGKYIKKFENLFANFVGSKYAVSCCNGTTALHLALTALKIKNTDNIITSNYTFVATAESAKYCTDDITFVDADKTWNINPDKIKIKKNTKVLMPVHLYGNPCDMDKIMKIANENKLFVVEDAAEALGAYYDGKHVGTFGDIGCFSFFGNKIITTGEGGMCVTDDENLYEIMKSLRHHGETNIKYLHDKIGFNYCMSNIQAAVGCVQLEKITEILNKRKEIKKIYDDLLAQYSDKINFQVSYDKAEPVNWLYTIDFKNYGLCNKIKKALEKNNIEIRSVFYPMNFLKPYGNKKTNKNDLCYTAINLPTYTELTIYDQIKIIDVIEEVLKHE